MNWLAMGRIAMSKYERRTIGGGVGRNLPQEAQLVFTEAIVDIDEV
jgi:hypothetical protein